MSRTPSMRLSPEQAAALARTDRRRILLMSLLALVLLVGYLASRSWRAEKVAEEQSGRTGSVGTMGADAVREKVLVPEFDRPDLLAAVRDATADDRVLVDREPLEALLGYARLLTPRHFEEMGIRELEPELLAAIGADPHAHRVQPFSAHGTLAALTKRGAKGDEFSGSLRLEQGGWAHFVLQRGGDQVGPGEFVLLEGLFLKLFTTEVDGGWREGPLLVGGRLVRSFPDRPHPAGLDALLAGVRDDELSDFSGMPWEAFWELLRAAREPSSEEAWATVPEVDHELLTKIFLDGDAYRGQRFRIPISINLHTWIERPDENPARLREVTHGWISNMTWKGLAKVVQFYLPGAHAELLDSGGSAHYVTARGTFVKNVIYEARTKTPERVPLFVMESVEPFVPEQDPLPRRILWAVFGGTLFFIGLLGWLIARDKHNSRALHEELVRRRRARRKPASGAPAGPADPGGGSRARPAESV